MEREYPHLPFERYADDVIVHCKAKAQAKEVLAAIDARMRQCKLELHPDKTVIVYCQDANRRATYRYTKFNFLGYEFRQRKAKNRTGQYFASFSPAISVTAGKAIRDDIRRWQLHLRSSQSLDELAHQHNPTISGWIQYYGRFYRSVLYRTLQPLDYALARWACRKYKKLRRHQRRASRWIARISRRDPTLFAHWQLMPTRGSMTGAV